MNILSKRSNLFLALIKLLMVEDRLQEEVLEQLDISKIAFKKIIEEVNEFLQPVSIHIVGDYVHMEIPQYLSSDYCFSKILENSIEYSIMEILFFEEGHTYLSLAEKVFISESTVKRTIRQLNSSLNLLDIHIDTKPLKIIGDERQIRLFFILFFKDKYGIQNPPFNRKDIDYVSQLYKIGSKLFKFKSSIQECFHFTFWTLISLHREKMGYKTNIKISSLKLSLVLKSINQLSKISFLGLKRMPKEFTVSNLTNAFSTFLSDSFLKTDLDIEKTKKKKATQFSHINNFINGIITKYDLCLLNRNEQILTQEIYEAIYGFLAFPKETVFYNDYYKDFLNYNDFFTGSFITSLKKLYLKEFGEEKINYFPYTAYIIITHWEKIIPQLRQKVGKIKVYIYIDYDLGFGQFIGDKLLANLSEFITVSIINQKQHNSFKDFEFDLLITNVFYKLDFPKEKIIGISHFLGENDFNRIQNFINIEYKKKLDNFLFK